MRTVVLVLSLLLASSAAAGELVTTYDRDAATFLELSRRAHRVVPGALLGAVFIPGADVVAFYPLGIPTRGLVRESYIAPVWPDGTCDTDAECETRCSGMCSDSGHGDEVCNVEVTEQQNGQSLCSADCGACGSARTAVCFVSCGLP